MQPQTKLTQIGHPVAELPVVDVERAQRYYRDTLGFEIGWLYPDKSIGAVIRDQATIFFRRRELPFHPAIHWVFAPDIDATYAELKSLGANIDAAVKVGKDIAEKAKAAGITAVVFDRGGFLFHGRVKALADAAREGGLEF